MKYLGVRARIIKKSERIVLENGDFETKITDEPDYEEWIEESLEVVEQNLLAQSRGNEQLQGITYFAIDLATSVPVLRAMQ